MSWVVPGLQRRYRALYCWRFTIKTQKLYNNHVFWLISLQTWCLESRWVPMLTFASLHMWNGGAVLFHRGRDHLTVSLMFRAAGFRWSHVTAVGPRMTGQPEFLLRLGSTVSCGFQWKLVAATCFNSLHSSEISSADTWRSSTPEIIMWRKPHKNQTDSEVDGLLSSNLTSQSLHSTE